MLKQFVWLVIICCLSVLPVYSQTASDSVPKAQEEISWFNITAEGIKLGYHKEVREKTTYQQQPVWRISGETVFTTPFPNQPKRVSALCYVNQDNLSLIKASATIYMADGTEVRINTQRKENELIITYTPPGRSVKATISPQEEIYPMGIIGDLIAARGLVKNKSYRIKIPYPDRLAHPITELVITVKEKVKETIMGKSVEGYYCDCSYSEPDVKKEPIGLLINTQGRILKRIVGLVEITRVSEKEALHKPRDRFEKNNRTDPFMPKDVGNIGRVIPLTSTSIGLTEWQAMELIKEAREALENMKRIHEKLPPGGEREKALTKEYVKILDAYKEMYKTDFSRLKEQIAEIRDEADKIFLPAQLIYSQIKHLHAESLRIFDKIKTETQGNFRQKLFNKLTNKLNQITFILDKNQIVIQETEYESKVKALVAEVEEFNRRAKIIIEFYGRNLKINGIIYILERKVISYPSLKITFLGIEIEVPVAYCRYRPNSSALINDRFYNEGEKIDEETISIDKIEANKIYFRYKGEKIELIYSK